MNYIKLKFEGFGIYHVEDSQIKLINFDIISNDIEQKSKNAIRGFRLLRKQNWFKKIEKKQIFGVTRENHFVVLKLSDICLKN
jgi:hypothetical protein